MNPLKLTGALQSAIELAKLSSAKLYIVTVIERLPAYVSYVSAVAPEVPTLLKNERRSFYEDLQGQAKRLAEHSGVTVNTKIAEGDEIQTLLDLSEDILPDLLVVGLRLDPSGFGHLLGGTAHRLALRARCNILGIR